MTKIITIEITNQTLRAGHETYKIGNLTKIGKYIEKADNSSKERAVFWGWIIITGSLVVTYMAEEWGFLLGILVGTLLIVIGNSGRKVDKFGLLLETNSGSNNLFYSENEQFIDKLVSMIHKIMDNGDVNANYTVNIKDEKIINNSSSNDTINISNSSSVIVKSEVHGTNNSSTFEFTDINSVEQLLEALDQVAEESDQAPNKKIRQFKSEILSENPSRETLSNLWNEILRALPQISKISSNFHKIIQHFN